MFNPLRTVYEYGNAVIWYDGEPRNLIWRPRWPQNKKLTSCIRKPVKICLHDNCYSVELNIANICDFLIWRASNLDAILDFMARHHFCQFMMAVSESMDPDKHFGIHVALYRGLGYSKK